MLSAPEIILIFVIVIGVAWWWRIHGQRDLALKVVEQHCKKLNITLLDGYVALKQIKLQRDNHGKLRIAKYYNFEFTVTGEQRYTGSISLYGFYVANIILPPYPFNPQQASEQQGSIIENRPHPTILTLDDYRKRKNND